MLKQNTCSDDRPRFSILKARVQSCHRVSNGPCVFDNHTNVIPVHSSLILHTVKFHFYKTQIVFVLIMLLYKKFNRFHSVEFLMG